MLLTSSWSVPASRIIRPPSCPCPQSLRYRILLKRRSAGAIAPATAPARTAEPIAPRRRKNRGRGSLQRRSLIPVRTQVFRQDKLLWSRESDCPQWLPNCRRPRRLLAALSRQRKPWSRPCKRRVRQDWLPPVRWVIVRPITAGRQRHCLRRRFG